MLVCAFPCDIYLAAQFCRRMGRGGVTALILRKQEGSLKDIFDSYGIKKVYAIDEDFYGKITCDETKKVLSTLKDMGVTGAYFPINNFCGNTALMLSIITDNIKAVNAASDTPVEISLHKAPWNVFGAELPVSDKNSIEIQEKIVSRIKSMESVMTGVYSAAEEGERPTSGLTHNSPYDYEVLSRYMYAASRIKDKVLEIGCGIGYGALAIAELNPHSEVTAIDYDKGAIEIAERLWGSKRTLSFRVLNADILPFEDHSFDSVICYEVVEHVKDPHALLREINRILKKGGILIASTPNYLLYPYRTNKEREDIAYPADLRKQGIWPWHIQELNENLIRNMLLAAGFVTAGFKYPTFIKGISMLNEMVSMDFHEKTDYLSIELKWSVDDFAALDRYVPIFSGHSFIFEASKEGNL